MGSLKPITTSIVLGESGSERTAICGGDSACWQVYLLLSCCPCEGRISGIVDVPNACATLAIPVSIFDQVCHLTPLCRSFYPLQGNAIVCSLVRFFS